MRGNSHYAFVLALFIPFSHYKALATCSYYTCKLSTFAALHQELEQYVTKENPLVWPYLDHINSHLHNAVLACKAATTCSSHHQQAASTSFTPKEAVAPGKKMEHQWRFIKTTKPPGCRKAGIVLRYFGYFLVGIISSL